MINVLITGSQGFVGLNLINLLNKSDDIHISQFKRGDTYLELEPRVLAADYIIHLAGEVRPSSSNEQFTSSNLGLTEDIVDILTKNKKNTPIIFTSTIHAENPIHIYGKTKRSAELLIERYSSEYNVKCKIYRLPHVFGEGCKPNYNSVISTWMFNSVNDLEINVYDRNVKMTYCYVQDVVKQFSDIIVNQESDYELYCSPSIKYNTTLGEVADYINEFKVNDICNLLYDQDDFRYKLAKTYISYFEGNSC
tara:strand:+ start:6431 stop:7183 length:753 start_codon:yes stop_codon:yes gene_type:complete